MTKKTKKKRLKEVQWELRSRSGMPDERNDVPFGPSLTPGICAVAALDMFLEKLPPRGLLEAMKLLIDQLFIKRRKQKQEQNQAQLNCKNFKSYGMASK